jgi:hypothetical protein
MACGRLICSFHFHESASNKKHLHSWCGTKVLIWQPLLSLAVRKIFLRLLEIGMILIAFGIDISDEIENLFVREPVERTLGHDR